MKMKAERIGGRTELWVDTKDEALKLVWSTEPDEVVGTIYGIEFDEESGSNSEFEIPVTWGEVDRVNYSGGGHFDVTH